MNHRRDLSSYVPVEVTPDRVERAWHAVSERVQRRSPGRWAWVLVPAVCAGALALGVSLRQPDLVAAPRPGQSWEAEATGANVAWGHGSALALRPGAQVSVPDSVASPGPRQFKLQRGNVEITLAEADEPWRVLAADVVLDAQASHFFVELIPERGVRVGVIRGAVWLHRSPGAPAEDVRAGQTVLIEGVRSAVEAVPPTPVLEAPAAERTPDDGEVVPERPAVRRPPSPAPQQDPEPSGAKGLWDAASGARRGGDAAGAARLYAKLISDFPGDGRVGLAAFELGRLRMDRLGDLPGAVSALRQAVRQSGGAGFREDALARLVRAYRRQGATTSCESLRATYLRDYPRGVHLASVAEACR